MARSHNTDSHGRPFSDDTKLKVWKKGLPREGAASDTLRLDACNSPMSWVEYGNRNSRNGWEIDHIKPIAKGGTDDLDNLQPLNWNNNALKGDTYPWDYPLARSEIIY